MQPRLVASLALFALLLGGCSSDPASIAKRKLRQAFGDDAKGIEVRVDGPTATLTGTVAARSTLELAEEVVKSVPGVSSVENRISGPEARGLDKLRTEALDAVLELAVEGALISDAGASVSEALVVEAADGVVSLRGTVDQPATETRALGVAARVDGVKQVIDLVDTPR